jgi:N6-adenosine-specific RNA methylase IME4
MMFDEMPLREVCNKIIHALVVEPHLTEAVDSHHLDDLANSVAWPEDAEEGGTIQWDPVKWTHLSGNIRLVGRKGKRIGIIYLRSRCLLRRLLLFSRAE